MKNISKIVLAVYLLALLWLVLFKFSGDIPAVLANFQTRSLNVVPFLHVSAGNMADVVYNFIVFIPFGLLLSATCKRTGIWRKLAYIFAFSFTVETVQFVLAIGATDITDVIANSSGGLLGLAAYGLANKYIDSKKLDACIVVASVAVLVLFAILRTFVFKVRYQ